MKDKRNFLVADYGTIRSIGRLSVLETRVRTEQNRFLNYDYDYLDCVSFTNQSNGYGLEHLFSSALESRIHMMRYRRFFALGLEVSNFHSSSKALFN